MKQFSMILLVVIYSITCSIFLTCPVYADDDLQTYTVDETVITATKQETPQEEVPQPVSVITSDEVEKSPAYNVGEMLDTIPGVRIISSGTVGSAQGVSIRSLNGGPGSNKTLVLLDGRPVNDAWSGEVNWHSIPFELVDRVEVVRGPGSALYGSQASAGVISVFTKKPQKGFHGWFSLGHEMNVSDDITDSSADGYGRAEIGATRFGLNGSYGTGTASHFLSLGYRDAQQSFPTPNENKWENYDVFYKGNFEVSRTLSTQVSLDVHNNSWDNQAERTPTEDTNDQIAADVSARWLTGPGVLNGRAYVNRNNGESKVYSSNSVTGETTTRTGIIADYSLPLSAESMVIAGIDGYVDIADVDYDQTVVNMTYLGVGTINTVDAQSGAATSFEADTFQGVYGSDSQSYDETNVAIFAQYSRTFMKKFNVVAGGRFDMHSEFGSIFNPKAGLTYTLFTHDGLVTTVKANYGTAFRAPPMWGTFSQSLGGYGDPDLKPEKTKNTDIGLFQRFADFGHAELTFFHMDVTDLLINDKAGSTGEGYYVFVPNGADIDTLSFNQRKNLGSYSPKGFEAAFKVYPHRQIAVSGAYTYLDPGDFTFQTSNNRWNINLNGFIPVGDNRIEGEIRYNYTGDGYFFDYESRPYDAFATTDARVSFSYHDRTRISLHAKNLFDETYKLWHYAWQPGRTLLVSIESSF